MVEGAVPTLGFTLTYLLTHELRLGADVGIGLAVALLVVRVVQRQPVQFVVNSLVGIGDRRGLRARGPARPRTCSCRASSTTRCTRS